MGSEGRIINYFGVFTNGPLLSTSLEINGNGTRGVMTTTEINDPPSQRFGEP